MFSPARYDSLCGLSLPAPADTHQGKDDVADYLQTYSRHFALPVPLNSPVVRLHRGGNGLFAASTPTGTLAARQVVVATGPFQIPHIAGRTATSADGRTTDVDAVVWATGFRPDHSWLHVPGVVVDGQVRHEAGVTDVPGLFFLGLPWQTCRGSALLGFVGADAAILSARMAADARRSEQQADTGRAEPASPVVSPA